MLCPIWELTFRKDAFEKPIRGASCQERVGNDEPLLDERTDQAACVGLPQLRGDEPAVCITESMI